MLVRLASANGLNVVMNIETSRLILRRPLLADVPRLFEFLGDPYAMRYTHADGTLSQCRRRIAVQEKAPAARRFRALDHRVQAGRSHHRVGWSLRRPLSPWLGRRGWLLLRSSLLGSRIRDRTDAPLHVLGGQRSEAAGGPRVCKPEEHRLAARVREGWVSKDAVYPRNGPPSLLPKPPLRTNGWVGRVWA